MYTPLDWWFDYSIWLMLQFKFMMPAYLIAKQDEMGQWIATASLNGIKGYR